MIEKIKYKDTLKEIGNKTILDLEPIVIEKSNELLDLFKEIKNDFIKAIFNKKRKRTKL